MEYYSKNEKETYALAGKIALETKPGDVFALQGDLGSGKTTFVKGFAKALGVRNTITSPTYVILKRYSANHAKIKNLIHIDCYRLEGGSDVESIGLNEYIDDADSVILIEWPEKILPILQNPVKTIKFEIIDTHKRKMTVC